MGISLPWLFWGLFLVLLGVSVILKVLFRIEFPVLRVLLAIFAILWGIRILMGSHPWKAGEDKAMFTHADFSKPVADGSYQVVFGTGRLDLNNMEWPKGSQNAAIKLESVFSHGTLLLNPAIPTEVRANSAFSSASFPDSNNIVFGNYTYRNKAYKEGAPRLTVELNVVFGNLEVRE